MTSVIVAARARYSASVEERATVCCFFYLPIDESVVKEHAVPRCGFAILMIAGPVGVGVDGKGGRSFSDRNAEVYGAL